MEGDAKYIVWVNHGREGWHPIHFDTKEEAVEFILAGAGSYSHQGLKLTKALDLVAAED